MTTRLTSSRPSRTPRTSALLSRVMLAMLVLVWSITPAFPRAGAASNTVPALHAAPAAPAILVTRTDSTSLVIEGRSGTLANDDTADEPDQARGSSPALTRQTQVLANAARGAFIATAHPAAARLKRTLRLAGRAPPRA